MQSSSKQCLILRAASCNTSNAFSTHRINMKTPPKAPDTAHLFVKLPPALAQLVTAAALENRRSRAAEVALRLEKTFSRARRPATAK
jgi:hypothetical protein